MDLHLKQWSSLRQDESEPHQQQQPPSAKMARLMLDSSSSSALPFFVPQHPNNTTLSPAFPVSPSRSSSFPRILGQFSLGQRHELELQALIFRYLLAGASVPSELLHSIKKSLLSSPSYFIHPHYQPPTLLQSGYWGRSAMDPEPGRCRRTDGKKWRCSRDVVAGHKYCERHMHRGRNRSRKPVEIPTPTPTVASTGVGSGDAFKTTTTTTIPVAAQPLTAVAGGTHFSLSGSSPSIDLVHLRQSSLEVKTEEDRNPDARILRHFLDDWPKSLQHPETDFSLKLSTGSNDDERGPRDRNEAHWTSGWGAHQVGGPTMGGPLAEALRSLSSSSSPTSVLHQLQPPRGAASDTSYVSN